MAEVTAIREVVRERYAALAKSADGSACCEDGCGCGDGCEAADDAGVFGVTLYDSATRDGLPASALHASLGCGVPTAVADLHEGQTVLDLGSGGGADVLISAKRVGPTGKAIGLDMTDEMLDLGRRNATAAGAANVEFMKGYIEEVPLPDASVDVIISNCVINLSGDKSRVIHEAARVLRPGGLFAVSDVIADENVDDATASDMAAWTACIDGALTRAELASLLAAAGFREIEIRETHRVHERAGSAIIRARKPSTRPRVAGNVVSGARGR